MKKPRLLTDSFVAGLPSFVWLVVFYAFPVVLVLLFAFKEADVNGGIGDEWTLKTVQELSNPVYAPIIWRTIWQGLVATLVCIQIAIPVSYQLARMTSKWRNFLLLLIIVPFWTNFLIRIYAWKVFLHANGAFKQLLVLCGLAEPSTSLLYNQWAVLVVMIYTYLPFAILPIYSAAEKFDFSLIDAAKDLGASSFYAYCRVFLPGIFNGVWAAFLVVFIPALGAYLIPSLIGGSTSELLGDKIAQRVLTDRNLPMASALSALLMLAVFLPVLIGYLVPLIRGDKAEAENPDGKLSSRVPESPAVSTLAEEARS